MTSKCNTWSWADDPSLTGGGGMGGWGRVVPKMYMRLNVAVDLVVLGCIQFLHLTVLW